MALSVNFNKANLSSDKAALGKMFAAMGHHYSAYDHYHSIRRFIKRGSIFIVTSIFYYIK